MSATYDIGADERIRFRRFLIGSAAVHATLLLFLALSPSFTSAPALPGAITVDLVGLPGPAPAPKAAAAEKPAAAKPPAPPPAEKPKPVAPAEPIPPPPEVVKPVPPPPSPKAEKVLPKEATQAPEKVKPAPKPVKAAPAPKPAAKPAPPVKQASIDDVLSQLRDEAGEAEPVEIAQAPLAPSDLGATGAGGGSVRVSPEVMAWLKSARIHVRKNWVLAPGFRLEPLATQIRVTLDTAGNVIGDPEILRRSGNPWYDESVVRAIQKASPLPPPPSSGEWDFLFQPEEG